MSLLSYNFRGLGNQRAVGRLKKLLNNEAHDIVFLMETKRSAEEMQVVKSRLGFSESYFVDSEGRAGGLALLWNDNIGVTVLSASLHHIDCIIKGLFCEEEWRLTCFYGWASAPDKHLSWELLRSIRNASLLPWLVVGDMNQILFEAEKEGGQPRSQREMDEFREAMDECGLIDLGYFGKPFTWWNKQTEQFAVFERLDRGVASLEWIQLLPHIGVIHRPSDKSDHIPIELTTMPRSGTPRNRCKPFRFEDMWLSSPDCEEVVKGAWTSTVGDANDVLGKICNPP
ncbi:uncharacterized protein [Spinacia oleracea]|uniref:Endonuclease/exonuclease/phosphatase domain-containing protein n=1 Tax=Spinacia oleracea TaxID=3562 RepID=A0A9R0I4J0_SPIOL|nr:uncharacterized protein LOC110782579 [Spinacia oleracea]